MEQVIVRYKVKPERVEENEELVRAVYAELDEKGPRTFHYATFKLADGVSFVQSRRAMPPMGRAHYRSSQRSSVSRRTSTSVATNAPSSAPRSRSARTDGFPTR